MYKLDIVRVNEQGKTISNETITETTDKIESNYGVWKSIFKGLDSVSLNEEGILSYSGKYGEQSILNVVEAMNHTGIRLKYDDARSQRNFYQPMKHSDTHYSVTEGAIK
jgi:hypothetical protein